MKRFLLVFLAAAILYGLSSGPHILERSTAPHLVYQALAFLHGRLDLEAASGTTADLTIRDGKTYLAFPPGPAVLLVPFAAIWGEETNDIIFTILLGALNVALMDRILGRLLGAQGGRARRLGTLLFGCGTVHWYLSCFGQLWHTEQVAAATGVLLAMREVFGKKRPLITGLWFAAAGFARPTVLFAFPFFLIALAGEEEKSKKALAAWARFLIPLLILAGLYLAYNYARFGSPLDFGYADMNVSANLKEILAAYGPFNPAFVPRNLHYMFVAPFKGAPAFPFLAPDPVGNGLLLTSPAFLLLFWGVRRDRRTLACTAGALAVVALLLFYYNTGWYQFGYRFALDFIPFLMPLTAIGIRRAPSPLALSLIIISVLVNGLGTQWYSRQLLGY